MATIGKGTRVECIYKGKWNDAFGEMYSGPELGSKWIVSDATTNAHGIPGYWIQLYSLDNGYWYDAGQFRPIEDGLAGLKLLAKKPVDPDAKPVQVPARKLVDA